MKLNREKKTSSRSRDNTPVPRARAALASIALIYSRLIYRNYRHRALEPCETHARREDRSSWRERKGKKKKENVEKLVEPVK